MKHYKYIILVLSLVVVLLSGYIVYLYSNNKCDDNDIDSKDNNIVNNIVNKDDTSIKELDYDCSFTRTFRYLGRIDYETYVDNTSYIMVDFFQSYEPMLLIVPDSYLAKMEENKYYEFTYTLKGTMNEITDFDAINVLIKATLDTGHNSENGNKAYLEINSTDKVGMEQASESICKGKES